MIIRAVTSSRVSSPGSVELRESLLNELEGWTEGAQDPRVERMMNLVLDGQEPTVQLFGGATLTDLEKDV